MNAPGSTEATTETRRMTAIRVASPRGVDGLTIDQVEIPKAGSGDALVRVHAAAITRDELEWSVDRLPAIPSYELSGVIAALGPNISGLGVGDAVWALTSFDRDGAAAEYAVVPASFLAPKPRTLGHLQSATIPLAGLTAWQGLFDHGRLRMGERVMIHGAAGGVGQFATQLSRWCGAYVIGTASSSRAVGDVLAFGADEAVDRSAEPWEAIPPGRSGVRHRRRRGVGTLGGGVARGRKAGIGGRGTPGGSRREGRGDVLRRRAQPRAAHRARPDCRRGHDPAVD
jgi:NADPH:quinone reductase-like Zn-dependent oxidoreductase